MKKCKRITFVLLLLTFALFAFVGCGSFRRLSEEKIYLETIDAFFTALENKDSAAVKTLFSQTVIRTDEDLDQQIDWLISIYPSAKTEVGFDGAVGGDYENQDGRFRSTVYTTFPVACDGRYYWVYFELIYEDDFLEENIGLNRVFFYTADEYCAFYHNENEKYPDDIGLLVFADLKFDKAVRSIEGWPYEFTPTDRTITVLDVEAFLESGRSWSKFVNLFGQPNAIDPDWAYFYEVIENDGSTSYLKIGIPNGEITYANIVDEFGYIRSIL